MIQSEHRGSVAVIRYDNPPLGTMTAKAAGEFLVAVEAALASDNTRVIILTGTGDVFVRHFDLASIEKAALALNSGKISVEEIGDNPFARLMKVCSESPKPVIAAINGMCMGGGFELALCCDIRIASEAVEHIGLPEIRAGIFPGGGGVVRLPRLIGESRACEFMMRGTIVNAATAKDLGLIHDIALDSLELALVRAKELAARPAQALASIKRICKLSSDVNLEEALRLESLAFYELLRDDSGVAGTLRQAIEAGADLSRLAD